ncbi:MAG: hypothetical protein JXR70_12825 [Spirochaetales bacterium]|nr:hypothetical protein [Spirochaetales bacterium]
MAEPKKRDEKAPKFLQVTIKTPDGTEWNTIIAAEKVFSTGSCGFYAGDKITNPESGERYQVGMNITLIGSKP